MTFGTSDVTFTCTLKPTDKNYRNLAGQWESRVRDEIVKYCTENVDCMEKDIPQDVWNRFVDWTSKFLCPRRNFGRHIKIPPSVRLSVSPSITNRVSAIAHKLLKQI